MELKMELSQKQVLSQHMVQSMEILQMSAQELEGYIEKLALENPVIELADSSQSKADMQQEDLQRKLDWLESTDLQNRVYYQQERDAENMEANWHDSRQSEENLEEYLHAQILLADYTELERVIMEYLICSLDSRGYFSGELAQVADHFNVSEEKVEELLQDIQELDPAGVGARNLQECLLLQIQRKKNYSDVTVEIIEHYMEEVAKNHLPNIAKKLQVSLEEVQRACEEIRSLNPKPGSSFSDREQLRYISPDAIEHIFDELEGREGILVASKIADRVGITRSVIVNALRKFESAGVIESRSSGMKGTYIKVLNDAVFEELDNLKTKND